NHLRQFPERTQGGSMPRYVIERTYDVDQDELPNVATRSKRIALEQFPAIVWEHSHVVADEDGTLKSFCIYAAPDVATVRGPAQRPCWRAPPPRRSTRPRGPRPPPPASGGPARPGSLGRRAPPPGTPPRRRGPPAAGPGAAWRRRRRGSGSA